MEAETDIITLEWIFSPDNFFEEEVRFERQRYAFVIRKGKVEVKIEQKNIEWYQDQVEEIQFDLMNLFLGAQLINGLPFKLSEQPSVTKFLKDGSQQFVLSVNRSSHLIISGQLDLIHRDPEGRVIRDTRRERIERRNDLAQLLATNIPRYPELRNIVERYQKAMDNPNEELVYLFEIREAIVKLIGNETYTRKKLGITNANWRQFGRLANDEPVRQGRHRGKHLDRLRDATDTELEGARDFTVELIEAYIRYRAETQPSA